MSFRRFATALGAVVLLAALVPAGQSSAFSGSGANGLIAIDTATALVALNPATGARSPLLGSVAADTEPSISPDGTKVAFGNGTSIFIAEWPTGNNRQQVTAFGEAAAEPAFSPNGAQLAFECPLGICFASATGPFPQTATGFNGTVATDDDPDWSPDGQFIVLDANAAPEGITRLNANNTGGRTTLNQADASDSDPRVLPNGSMVVFEATGGIVTMSWPNGGNRAVLTGSVAGDFDAAPSPDGTKVALTGGAAGIFTLNTNGTGGRAAVPGSVAGDTEPSWGIAAGGTATNPAPVFSADSACGGSSVLRVLPLFGPATAGVSASDTAGQTVSLAASGVPSYVTFASASGNPATGTLSISANPLEILNLLLAILLQTPSTVTVTATDNGTPVASATCSKTVRIGIV